MRIAPRATLLAGLILFLPAGGLSAADSAKEAHDAPLLVPAEMGRASLADRTSYDFLESLTTDVGQRLAGTEAMVRAVGWAEAAMKTAGLDDVHRESFAMPAWIRGEERAEIVAPYPQKLAITALGGSVATPPQGVEAEIKLFSTYAAMLAAPPGSLAGKIAVVTQRMVRAQDGGGYEMGHKIRFEGPSEAAKRGALAFLLRSAGTDNHRLPHTGAMDHGEGVPRIPAAALSAPDAEQLERLAARGAVKLRLVLMPTERSNAESWNVVGEIKGREKPDEVVLIGAHLDSWDLGTGAIDDGAGVAIVLAAAKRIAALPQHPKRTIRVVLFGAEEMDYSGAAYAKAHAAEAAHVVIAGETDFGARPVYAAQLPAAAAKSEFATRFADALTPLGAYFDPTPAVDGGSDIEGLQKAGVPVVSLRQNGIDYFDIHHTADDTLDKVDSRELAQNASVWAVFAYLAAESDVGFRSAAAGGK